MASVSTSHTNRWRAAGQNVHTMARTAVSGAKTTMKCTSKTWAGSPLNVDNCHSLK